IALDAIIRRALDADAARRFPSAQALEIALDLVSLREGWLVPPSYVSSYLSDVLHASPASDLRSPVSAPAGDADLTPPFDCCHADGAAWSAWASRWRARAAGTMQQAARSASLPRARRWPRTPTPRSTSLASACAADDASAIPATRGSHVRGDAATDQIAQGG